MLTPLSFQIYNLDHQTKNTQFRKNTKHNFQLTPCRRMNLKIINFIKESKTKKIVIKRMKIKLKIKK